MLKLRWRPDDSPADVMRPATEISFEFLIAPATADSKPSRAFLRIYTGTEGGYPVSTVCWFTQNAAAEIQTAVKRALATATEGAVEVPATVSARRVPALSNASSSLTPAPRRRWRWLAGVR